MNYQQFNIKRDEHIQETINQINQEINSDPEIIFINSKIKECLNKKNYHDFIELINEKEKQININMYYQGFNDAISLLTKSFK